MTMAGNKRIIQQTFHEISRYKRIENVLKKTLTFAEGLIDSVPYMIFCKDKKGVYLGCNTAFAEFAGVHKNKIIGKTDLDIFPEKIGERFRKQDEEVLTKIEQKFSEEWVTNSENRKILLHTLRTIYYGHDDKIMGIIGITRDITEEKQNLEAFKKAESAKRQQIMDAVKQTNKNFTVVKEQLSQQNIKLNETLQEVEEAKHQLKLKNTESNESLRQAEEAKKQLNLKNIELNKTLREAEEAKKQLHLKNDKLNEMLVQIKEAKKQVNLKNNELNEALQEAEETKKQLNLKNSEINQTLEQVEEANQKIMSSIRYAKVIQSSLLPNLDGTSIYLPDSFVIWMPRDVVGGDIFFKDSFESGFVIAVIDCTGHGIPGAFMTMIASSGLRRIIKDEGCRNPAQILKELNFIVKTSLQQDKKDAPSDDGLDAAICFVSDLRWPGAPEPYYFALTFAGARLPLYYVHNDEVKVIKGDRQSIGYKKSDLKFNFTNHTIRLEKGMSFYMATDGFTDQVGGKKRRRFGTSRFKKLLKENVRLPFEEQREVFIQTFEEFRGDNERRDDLTMVGFAFKQLRKKP